MKPMATHTSATAREQASTASRSPHVNPTRTTTINAALRKRAQEVLNDKSIDAQSRAIIRYGLEINDPWLAELVPRAGAGERIADIFDFSQTTNASDDYPSGYVSSDDGPSAQTLETLADIICGAGDESAGALFVLMGTLQHSRHPEVLANSVKHLAFTRCGELNLFGMVDAQIAEIENELFACRAPVS
jgi:hypothetical protein